MLCTAEMRPACITSPLWPDTTIAFPALVHDHVKLDNTRSTVRGPCLVGNRASVPQRLGRRVRIAAGRSLQSKATSEGSAWIPSGALLATGGALPGLLLASTWQHVADMGPAYQTAALAAVDILFITTATAFLSTGSQFGHQRYENTPDFPGAFVEQDGERTPPAFFQAYVAVLPVLLGVLVPAAGLALLVKQGNGYLGACTLGLYLLELAAQLVSEGVYIKTKTVMWPQVPQVYQTYRIWQLIRGCYLVGFLNGPEWLWNVHAMLILLWTFNFGAVMVWTPWLYRWHLQPEQNE